MNVDIIESSQQLPPKYYRDYFHEVLTFVERMYSPILNQDEIAFLQKYYSLSENAQCLFIRLTNRTKSFFRIHTLSYSELDNISECLQELEEGGFIEPLNHAHHPAIAEIINLFTKPEILHLTDKLQPEVYPSKSIRKTDLVRWLLYDYEPLQLIDQIHTFEPIVKVSFEQEIAMIKFLFFGNRYADMSEFVIRDLGHVRFQSFDESTFTIRFNSRKEVDEHLTVSLMREVFSIIKNEYPPEEIFDWYMNWQLSFEPFISPNTRAPFDEFTLKVGLWLEKKKLASQALQVYTLTNLVPSRERRVRLLYQMGAIEEAGALCDAIYSAPFNADEKYFSIDFKEKIQHQKKRAVKRTTQALKVADQIELPILYQNQVELGAMHYFNAQGYQTMFTENSPWRSLFGLLFWDIIYDTNANAIHNPLQRSPSDFYKSDFYFKRKDQIHERLNLCDQKKVLLALISETYSQKDGTANMLVSWYDDSLKKVVQLIYLLKPEQLRAILLEMAQNLREHTRGFPDLLIWNQESFEFIEIKSPTDHLAARQLHWLHFFEAHQIPSRIVRVKWTYPDDKE